mmetsp:Transcript_14620/g.43925  ORF Transcript_14620/g.43925 Transcript_14620/m.43925 type:complete len:456 (-) Transcript_14620:85-1452(-)
MVVHQPRYEIWESLDEVLFLAPGGRTVFLGPQRAVGPYFTNELGETPSLRDNPADFYMDVISDKGGFCVDRWADYVRRNPDAARGSAADGAAPAAPEEQRKGSSFARHGGSADSADSLGRVALDQGVEVSLPQLTEALRLNGAYGDVELQARLLLDMYRERHAATDGKEAGSLQDLLVELGRVDRGSGFLRQLMHAHHRSVKQQINSSTSLAIELMTICAAGLLMGFASKFTFEGILNEPYTLLSPSSQVVTIPQSAMFVGMSVGLAAGPPGVNTFGRELVIYWREAAVGHSPLAYYIGKSWSMLYRILLCALHFTALYLIQCEQVVSSAELFLIALGIFWAVYGMASIVSAIIPIETASLVAVVVALIAPVFGGYVRNIPELLKKSTYAWWANEAFFTYATDDFQIYMVDKTAGVFYYTLDQTTRDLVMVFAIGLIYRFITYFLLVGLHREKQA